ncbi:unnamed protein product [Auanema sp. JU1783]|nr:unnamed protein product [Auanema sp. JU1783]
MIVIMLFIASLALPLEAAEVCTGLLCDDSVQHCAVGLFCKLNGFIGECCVNSGPATASPTNSPINPLLYLTTSPLPSLYQTTSHKYTTRDYTTTSSHRTLYPHVTHSTVHNNHCEDRVHPQTKISDCSSKKYLCNEKLYYNFMTYQCPKTCGRCSYVANPVTPSRICQDKVNFFTGVSDCAQKSFLCQNASYKSVMAAQCPRTCRLC